MPSVLNAAAYQFAPLRDLKTLRERLRRLCQGLKLRGTILLSAEGVNLFVAGDRPAVEAVLRELRSLPGLENLAVKESVSENQPFRRMLVRIKKEIIAFGVEGIDPGKRSTPKVAPAKLKEWLDEGRDVALLDTRNDYEVALGAFRGSVSLDIGSFREFPQASAKLPDAWKDRPVVMYCTGGIRCEKAGPFLESQGFRQLFQLDGGILRYFEDCGGAHYDGECFVFDQRVGLDPGLAETATTQCFACQAPLRPADLRSPMYVVGQSCPHCHRTPDERTSASLAARQEALRRAATPLPGSLPYENRRPLKIPHRYDGATLADFLAGIFPHIPAEVWGRIAAEGRLEGPDGAARLGRVVRAGERYYHVQPGVVEPAVNADIRVMHEDEAILVIDKPAPLPMHPCGRYHRNTLQHLVNLAWHPWKPRFVHRLDANTTGLVVMARTRHFAGALQPQFARGEVEKVYLARVLGHPPKDEFECDLPISTAPGEAGSRDIDDHDGAEALTKFHVTDRLADGTTLLQARPITGRTNQIRVHLWRMGWPVLGDRVYLSGQKIGHTQTLALDDPPLCLHAWKLAFVHPQSRQRVAFEAPPPPWWLGV